MVEAPAFHRSGRAWRDFRFTNLEKVSRAQVLLCRRLEWLLPGVGATGHVNEAVKSRLKELFDEDVRMVLDYVHVIPPKQLRKYVGEPTFMAVLAPLPHKTRGFMEVDLSLAHAAIDMLLGGAGETVALRPLTDIEEGVMTYVLIETLKTLAPSLDPGLPRLRLEGLVSGVDEATAMVAEEAQMVVVQLKVVLGAQTGYVRLFVPATVLSMVNPPADGEMRRMRRRADIFANIRRLAGVKTWLRAEIGQAEIQSADLVELREGDVVLVDQLTARPDKGEGGTARLRVGLGRVGWLDAEISVEAGRYRAKVTGFQPGEAARQATAAEPDGGAEMVNTADAFDEEANPDVTNPNLEGENVDESTLKSEGAELLNDIPLQIAVELARVPVTAEEVVSLRVGQVLDLNRVPGEPVELSVNGKIVARGELVEVEGHLGVRVLSLA